MYQTVRFEPFNRLAQAVLGALSCGRMTPLLVTAKPASLYRGIRTESMCSSDSAGKSRRCISARSRSGSRLATISNCAATEQIRRRFPSKAVSPMTTARRRLPQGNCTCTSFAIPSNSSGRLSTAAWTNKAFGTPPFCGLRWIFSEIFSSGRGLASTPM